MPITIVRAETNLDQLLGKVYAELKPAELKRVRDATLRTNPHLRIEGNFRPGTVIVLPELEQAVRKIPVSNDANVTDSIELILAEIKTYVPLLMRELELAREELDQSAKLLKSAAFKKAIAGAQSEEAVALEKGLESALKAEREANADTLRTFPKEADALQENLSALLTKLR